MVLVDEVLRFLAQQVAAKLGNEGQAVDVSARFTALGIDSVRATALMRELSQKFSIPLPVTMAWEHPTIALLAQAVVARLAPATVAAAPNVAAPLSPPQRTDASEPIAVVGMACRFPEAASVDGYWALLRGGVDAIREVPADRYNINEWYDADVRTPGTMSTRFGGFLPRIDLFDAGHFGISPREARQMDPQQRMMLMLACEALEDAGIKTDSLVGSPTGVYFGVIWNDYLALQHRAGRDSIDAYSATGSHYSIVANRVSYALGLQGPSLAVDTACSSSLVAIHLACAALRAGDTSLALAGGVNLIVSPDSTVAMSKFGAMAPDGRSKAFDARANGYVRGEGAGVVALKRLSDALRDGNPIMCVIRGTAVNNDGASNGMTAPNPQAQEAVLAAAYASARIDTRRVRYVEAHGTGTNLGDPIEASALGKVVGRARPNDEHCFVGSVKTNFGHLEAAAGIAGFIKAALVVKNRQIPPSLHFQTPNPHIDFDGLHLRVPTQNVAWPCEDAAVAGVSSFGFGGTNCHIVVEEWRDERYSLHLGTGATAADAWQQAAQHLEQQPTTAMGAVRAFAVANQDQTLTALELAQRHSEGAVDVGVGTPTSTPRVALVFPGQGAQYVGMGQALYRHEPAFRRAFLAADEAVCLAGGRSPKSVVFSRDAEALRIVDVIQPTLFALQVAHARLWLARGLVPHVVIGHSMGEVAAAHIAGGLSLNDAARVIVARSQLVRAQHSGSGAMALVERSTEALLPLLPADAAALCIAAQNGPNTSVVAGTPQAVDALVAKLTADGHFAQRVDVDYASHHPSMDALAPPLQQALQHIVPMQMQLRMVSTVTNDALSGPECGANYWVQNIRKPVRFLDATVRALDEGVSLFVEMGPHPTLARSIQATAAMRQGSLPSGHAVTTLASAQRDEAQHRVFLSALGAAFARGAVMPKAADARPSLLVLSAKSAPALRQTATAYLKADALWRRPVEDVASSLATQRALHDVRAAAVACNVDEATAALRAIEAGQADGRVALGRRAASPPRCVFVYAGQGGQWWKMGRALQQESAFRETLESVDAELSPLCEWSILEQFNAAEIDSRVLETDVGQPLSFALQVALTAQLRAWGIVPDAIVGHSLGEVAAAHAASVLTLSEACRVVRHRSRLMRRVSGQGATAQVELGYNAALDAIRGLESRMAVAGQNSPTTCVLSGEPAAIDELIELLKVKGIFAKRLRVDVAFHSPQMDALKGELMRSLSTLRPQRATVPLFSTVTAKRVEGTELDAAYWARNLREPFLFAGATETLLSEGYDTFVEVGAHPVLLPSLRETAKAKGKPVTVVCTQKRDVDAQAAALWCVAELLAAGVDVDLAAVNDKGDAHAPLPTSPWQLERHWIVESQGASEQVVLGGHAIIGKDKPSVFPPHLAERLPEHVVQLYRWERPLSRESHKYVADHVILNTVVVPGVAYLEAVCSAAMRVLDGGVTLSDVKFERAMFLPDDEARIVEVSIAMTNGDGGRFFLSSKRRGEVDFTVHASGDLARATPRDLPAAPVLPMETSRARSHYERMRQNGLELGPAFHNIRALGVADGLAVGDIVLSEALKAEAQRYLVHPAFLDACLQVAYAALPQEVHAATDGDPMLPVSIRRFTMWRTTTFPHNATSTQRLIHRTEGRYSLDWTVADERGALLHADGFTFAQMTRAKAGEPQVLSTVWQPTPTPNSTRSLRSLLVCDADASASAWQQAEASSLTVVDATQALVQLESCSDTDVVLVSRTGDARQAYFLAQLCQAASKQRGVVVHLVTLGAFCVDGVGGAQTQALHGAMRAVAIETPQIAGWRIDVDAREPGHLAKTVLRVLMSEELRAEACVAVRGDAFFVERLAARGAVTSARQRCAPDATYLVTGGLSGVGGVAARLLVEDGARRLIVLARTPLPDRRQWKQGKHDPATRARIEAMQTLEQMGATVLYADVDVADRDAVSRAVERARGLLPPIRGVVHAAGAVAPQLLPALTQRSVDAVFAGKVDGLLAVLAATSGEPLDFVHTFSSAIGTLGLQGQFAYAAANAALDGIAASQRALGVPVTSFGFGAFAEVGMAAQRPDEARYLALAGLPAMEPRAALRRMAGVSLAAEAHALVAAIDGRALQSHFADSRTASVIAGLAPTPVAADRTQASREPLAELATVPTDGRVAWLTTYLQQQIARVLRYDAAQLDINARLNSVGLDSIMAAEVRNRIELELRARIPMVTLLQGPTTIELATQVLALVTDKIGLALESAVGGGSEHATAAEEHHALVPAPHARNEAFALTDIQHAYWFGRQGLLDLANIPTHVYVELDGQLDPERLDRAWTRMIERHDMLRAVFLQNGMQQVLKEVPEYHIDVVDLRQKPPVLAEAEIARARQRMAGSAPPLEAWPHFEIRLHLLPGGKTRLHFNVDMLIVDAFSVALIFKAWRELYENPERARSPLEVTFRDYVLAEAGIAKSSVFEKSKAYWMKRLPQLPGPPALPQAPNPDVQKIKQPVFTHRFGKVDAPTWATLKSKAGQKGLTPASLLGSGLAETVARFSKQKQFAINVTLFKRLPLHPQVNDVIGDFTSTTLLGVDWAKDATFEDRARRLTAQLWEDMDHPHMSGVSVLRELSKHTGSPVIQPVIFTCALGDFGQAVDWAGDLVYHATETSQVTLDNRIQEYRGELLVSWDTLEEQYPDHLLDDMHGSYVELLYRLATSEQAWSGQSRYALPAAQQATREAINATQAPVPDGLLHTPLHRHHEERGDAPAVIAHDRTLTHRELQQHAWGLGAALRDAGALPNRLIAVVTEPGWQRPLAALAVIESGAAYLPIDPALPADRIAFLLENAEVTHVVTTAEVKQRLVFPEHVRLWIVDSPDAPRANTPPPPVAVPTDLAYVIFTSGSTGVPKGVMVDHRGALNTCVDVNTRFGVSPSDRALALANLSFDLSVYDIFGVLAAGGALVYPAPHATRDPGAWLDLVDTHKVTLWNSVPMLLSMLVAHTQEADAQRLASLRVCMLSGDWVPLELPDQVRRLIKNVRLISMGGATEASIWSIIYEIKNINKDWRSIPYGVPMVNQSFYVLDAMLEPCPNWVTGDLYIGGIGLARGYWKDQAKTEASFIVHPHTGERLYRTGDLGRYFPDGNIEFLGRQDAQVKLQGHRVELGEIEAVMRQYPKAEDAFVLLRQHRASIPGYAESVAQNTVIPRFSKKAAGGQNAFLIGYVVCPKDVDVSEEDVRAFLRSKLPEYMVPARVIVIHEIPLGSNGKVDRRALPNPDRFEPEVQVQVTAPASETEHLLLRVWGEVLGLPPERLSVTDSFFDLGGNSLLLVEVATRLRQAKGVEVKIADLFRLPTVRQLGEHLSADADGKGDDGADKARSRADKMRRLQKRD